MRNLKRNRKISGEENHLLENESLTLICQEYLSRRTSGAPGRDRIYSFCLWALNSLQPRRPSRAASCRSVLCPDLLQVRPRRTLPSGSEGLRTEGHNACIPTSLDFLLWPSLGAGSRAPSRPLWACCLCGDFLGCSNGEGTGNCQGSSMVPRTYLGAWQIVGLQWRFVWWMKECPRQMEMGIEGGQRYPVAVWSWQGFPFPDKAWLIRVSVFIAYLTWPA